MTNRITTLAFQGQESDTIQLEAGVPQGSSLLPILFLFYNAGLLELCENRRLQTIAVGFVDNTNILAYSLSMASNCRALEKVHTECLKWARKHGIQFALNKYKLIHFTRRQRAFDLTEIIQLEGTTKEPSPDIRVLGV